METFIYKVYPVGYKDNDNRYDMIATKRSQSRWTVRDWHKINARISEIWGSEASSMVFRYERIANGITI